MGLDMFLHKRQSEEIGYWRKHNRLHGLFEEMWREKFPDSNDDFNCTDFRLSMEDLNKIEVAIKNRLLPKTSGFFFGEDSYDYYDSEMQQTDLDIIKEAKEAIKDDYEVVYSCWW
jgi:hypothetical protein